MKCPTCGKQTKGVDHNNRGRRCTACWARLPDEPPRPKRRRKPNLPAHLPAPQQAGLPAQAGMARTSAKAETLEAASLKPTPQTV